MTGDRLRFDTPDPEGPEGPAGAGARSKTEASAAPPPRRRTRVIVKVRTRGYVPPGFDVRSRVDDTLFTALAHPASIQQANGDPRVVSVAPARRLRPS